VQNSSAQSNRGGGIYNNGSAGSAALTILNSTISGNYAYSAGGAIYNDAVNGGSATLTIMNGAIEGNSSIHGLPFHGGAGGGIYNDSSGGNAAVTIHNSCISGNYTSSAGGGIYNDAVNGGSATLTIVNSTIDGNGAAYNDIGLVMTTAMLLARYVRRGNTGPACSGLLNAALQRFRLALPRRRELLPVQLSSASAETVFRDS
jgi:hypothetical protein